MVGAIVARVLLALFIAPFLLLFSAMAFALTASQLGEYPAISVTVGVVIGILLLLSWWLAGVERSFGRPNDPAV